MESLRQNIASMHIGEYHRLLLAGHPPLYLQLLFVNGLVFVFWASRRMRARKRPAAPSAAFAILLVILNAGVLYYSQMNA